MALTKVTGQVIKNTTDVTVGVLTVTNTLAVGGTVSVGGTLTYEDVTNIDSVGLITARNGIVVGSGITLSKDGDGFFTGIVTATTFSGALAASSLTGALPAISAANLTNVPAANITGTLPAISGANLTNLDASDLASGTVPTARLGSGTASSSTFLRGDSTFAAVTSTTINNNANNYVITGSGTANTLEAEANLTFDGTILNLTKSSTTAYDTASTTNDSAANLINSGASGHATLQFQSLSGGSAQTGQATISSFNESSGSKNTALTFGTRQNSDSTVRERLRIDSSGRVLLGTSSSLQTYGANPSLQVAGTSFDTSTLLIRRDENNANPPAVVFGKSRGSAGGNTVIQDDDQVGSLIFAAADGTDLTSIAAEIKVQIDGSPGSNDVPGRITFNTTADGGSSPTERARIDSTGKLFVATTSGGDASATIRSKQGVAIDGSYTDYLHACYEAQVTVNSGGESKRAAILNSWDGNIHGASIAMTYDGGYNLIFAVNNDTNDRPSERFRIFKNGNITTNGNTSLPTGSSHGFGFSEDQFYLSYTGTGANYSQRFYNGNGLVGSILVNGSSTSYNTSSDYRLKENTVSISDGITRLKQLKPYRFNFIKDASTTLDGFYAHEAQAVVPQSATGTKDEVESSDNEDNGAKAGDPIYQGMDHSALVPLLTAALQEAVAKIETLETKVAALEG